MCIKTPRRAVRRDARWRGARRRPANRPWRQAALACVRLPAERRYDGAVRVPARPPLSGAQALDPASGRQKPMVRSLRPPIECHGLARLSTGA